jgi:hypothetical protein
MTELLWKLFRVAHDAEKHNIEYGFDVKEAFLGSAGEYTEQCGFDLRGNSSRNFDVPPCLSM